MPFTHSWLGSHTQQRIEFIPLYEFYNLFLFGIGVIINDVFKFTDGDVVVQPPLPHSARR